MSVTRHGPGPDSEETAASQTLPLLRHVQATVERHGLLREGDRIVIGVSGGPDSLALLHALRQLAPHYGISLHAAHLNHQLRGDESDADAEYVRALCQAWDIPCTPGRVEVAALAAAHKLSIEEAARRARYAFLADQARLLGATAIAVAHHADDQVETVLMHFLRGAGLAGLRGMRPCSWVDELRLGDDTPPSTPRLRLIRPLLETPREEILAYCDAAGIAPRFDRSNLDQTLFRNRLRHELIPLLETYNPNIRAVTQRTAEALAADYEVLRGLVERTWAQVVRSETDRAVVLDLAALRAQPLGIQRSLLREAVHRLRRSLRNINWVHIDDAVRLLNTGETGAQSTLPQGLVLTLGYDAATVAAAGRAAAPPPGPALAREALAVPREGVTRLPGGWVLRTQIVERAALPPDWEQNPDPYVAYLDAERLDAPLALRARLPGDRFEPLGLGGRQKVGDFLTNARVPRAERDRVPILVSGEAIVWLVGWRINARFAISPATRRVLVARCERLGSIEE